MLFQLMVLAGMAWIVVVDVQSPPNVVPKHETKAPPAALRTMVDRRLKDLRTAHIESCWRFQEDGRERAGYYTHKFAHGDLLEVFRGDGEGLVLGKNAGDPFSYSPIYVLRDRGGKQWRYFDAALDVAVTSPEVEMTGTLYDFRIWGLQPLATGPTSYSKREGHQDPRVVIDAVYRDRIVEVTESRENGMLKIVLRFLEGGEAEYLLAPDEGYSPRRIVVLNEKKEEVCRSESRFVAVDGYWFPKYMAFALSGKPWVTVEVLHASFNRKEHLGELSPGMELGLIAGTNIGFRTQSGWEERVWDGAEIATWERFSELRRQGILDSSEFGARVQRYKSDPPGRHPLAAMRILVRTADEVKCSPRLWEEYTRDFISIYDLRPDQAASAWDIWRECFEMAQKHLQASLGGIPPSRAEGHRETDDSETDSGSAATLSADSERPSGVMTGSTSMPASTLQRMEQIFEQRLKARLKALLTVEQSAAAAKLKERIENQAQSSLDSDD